VKVYEKWAEDVLSGICTEGDSQSLPRLSVGHGKVVLLSEVEALHASFHGRA